VRYHICLLLLLNMAGINDINLDLRPGDAPFVPVACDRVDMATSSDVRSSLRRWLAHAGMEENAANVRALLDGVCVFCAREGTSELIEDKLVVSIVVGANTYNITARQIKLGARPSLRRVMRRLADYTRDLLLQSGIETKLAAKHLVPLMYRHLAFDFSDAITNLTQTERHVVNQLKIDSIGQNAVVVPRGNTVVQSGHQFSVDAPIPNSIFGGAQR